MKHKLKRPAIAFVVVMTAVMVVSCGTFFNVRITSPRSWLEGKDYTIQFSMGNADKIQKVTLYYRVNDNAYQMVEPALNGTLREYTIPAGELAVGRLDYYVVVLDMEGKEHKEGVTTVSILSMAEGKARAEQDFARRIKVTAPREMPVIDDLEITVGITRPRDNTALTIFIKNPSDAGYRAQELTPSGGLYRIRLKSRDLEEGEFRYYFTLSEEHPDFGKIDITYPARGDTQPLSVKVIGLSDLAERMEGELARSIEHQPVEETLSSKDLSLSMTITIPSNSLLHRLINGRPEVILSYGRGGRRSRFDSVPMRVDRRGTYTGIISRRSLVTGVNSYYFSVSAITEKVGSIDIFYPEQGRNDPFRFKLVTLSQLRQRYAEEYAGKITHVPPADISTAAPLTMEVIIKDAPRARRGELFYLTPSGRRYMTVSLKSSDKGLTGTIPARSLEQGMMRYYFTITLTFPDAGIVQLSHPVQGASRPLSVMVGGDRKARKKLEADLAGRIKHDPVTETDKAKGFIVTCTVRDRKPGTTATLYLKRSTDAKFTEKRMKLIGDIFTSGPLTTQARAGFNTYYLEVAEPHPAFKTIAVTVPAEGKGKPYVIQTVSPGKIVFDSIEHSKIKAPTPGRPLTVSLKINKNVTGSKVSLAYRVKGQGRFTLVAMRRRGLTYSATIDKDVITPGAEIEYYFAIAVPGVAEDVLYPAQGTSPLSFIVPGKDGGKAEKGRKGKNG